MKLQHPQTGKVFEVSEDHGNMLLKKGFYKEYVQVDIVKQVKRNGKRSNKQG